MPQKGDNSVSEARVSWVIKFNSVTSGWKIVRGGKKPKVTIRRKRESSFTPLDNERNTGEILPAASKVWGTKESPGNVVLESALG